MVRLKTRFVLVEVDAGKNTKSLKKEDVSTCLKASLVRNYGDYGAGLTQFALQVVYWNQHTRLAAIRCAREVSETVQTSLVLTTEHNGGDIRLRLVRICGSNRTCKQHLMDLSMERRESCRLDGVYKDVGAELEAGISLIDPQ